MLHVTVYNLSVCLATDETKIVDFIETFLKRFYTQKAASFGSAPTEADKVYVSKIKDRPVWFLHINQFRHLLHEMHNAGIPIDHVQRDNALDYNIVQEPYQLREGWKLRDYQEEIVEFILDEPRGSKMISLQTGSGKTLISLYALAQLKQRIGVVIIPQYLSKWLNDIVTVHDTTTKDVMLVQGSKELRGLITMAQEGTLQSSYLVFSARTLQIYITEYEQDPELCVAKFGCAPIELFPLLGIGSMLIDETHQHFHAIYKILLHCNVRFQLGLSATLLSDDAVVSRMHQTVYPPKSLFQSAHVARYINVSALAYHIPQNYLKQVRTSNYGSKSYSHTAFEQSMLRQRPLKEMYVRLIDNALKDFYLDLYQPKDKCLIFVSTVSFATYLTQRYAALFPDKVVRRYCEDDPFEHLSEGDLIVSTVISAGTAVDIADLRCVVQTVCIASSVSNLQSLGRLRQLSGDRDVRFCYLYAENLNKQRQYHFKRLELFRPKVATHRTLQARTTDLWRVP